MKFTSKSIFIICLFLALIALILREAGILNFSAYRKSSDVMMTFTDPHSSFNVKSVVFSPANGKLQNYSKEPYAGTVSYYIEESLTPWRWVPFYKVGYNESRLIYLIWVENHLMGCGSISASGSQSMIGIASARDYAEAFNSALIDRMKKEAGEKLNIFHTNP